MHRSAHQILDEHRVFDDPLAMRIIGVESSAALQAAPQQFAATPGSDLLRAFIAARSRYAEDILGEAVRRGLRQYVILGAGLDTFAYRNPYTQARLHVFEVDHPATQSWKRARLEEAGISIPPLLTFVPVDFETQTIADGLRQATFDHGELTFFSWVGVIPYLTKEVVYSTLKFIAERKKGSGVVFDYVISPSLLDAQQRSAFDHLSNRVAKAGEPWQTFFEPSSLAADLFALGFEEALDLGPDEINARYFTGRNDNLKVRGFGHIMKAIV
ncbi:MAG: class I SAM-dependent methyltransferase [Syntrophales bacterium LBB04]|nr:class I SAM-dependent methyltransferase [Syntrophales bacterium LBB04]